MKTFLICLTVIICAVLGLALGFALSGDTVSAWAVLGFFTHVGEILVASVIVLALILLVMAL